MGARFEKKSTSPKISKKITSPDPRFGSYPTAFELRFRRQLEFDTVAKRVFEWRNRIFEWRLFPPSLNLNLARKVYLNGGFGAKLDFDIGTKEV